MTTFYFMMGIYVHLDGSFFQANFGYCILVSILNVFVSPVIMVTMGWFCGLKSRTAIYVSLLSNSLGETTLTLQVLISVWKMRTHHCISAASVLWPYAKFRLLNQDLLASRKARPLSIYIRPASLHVFLRYHILTTL
jgi:hypothetical protein